MNKSTYARATGTLADLAREWRKAHLAKRTPPLTWRNDQWRHAGEISDDFAGARDTGAESKTTSHAVAETQQSACVLKIKRGPKRRIRSVGTARLLNTEIVFFRLNALT